MGSVVSPQSIPPRISTWTSGAQRIVQENGGRWIGANTAKFLPECSVPAYGWPNKRDGSLSPAPRKAVTESCEEVQFDGIGIYASNRCIGGEVSAMTDFQERTARALLHNWQFVLSEEIMDGTWSALAGSELNAYQAPVSNSAKAFGAADEIQTITVDATGGTFTITFDGQTTSALAFNATGAAVTAAMEALSNVAPTDVVVTGGPGDAGGTTPYVFTWGGAYAATDVATPTTGVGSLTGGAGTAVVATTRTGVPAKGSTIRSAATTVSGAATSMKLGLSSLLREWRRYDVDISNPGAEAEGLRNGTTPVLHIPDWGLGFLPGDGATQVMGNQIWTNYGTVLVAPGPGYSGNAPGSTAPTQMPVGQFWAYLTGPVYFDTQGLPDPEYIDGLDGLDSNTDLKFELDEINAIAMFDPSGVFGALIEGMN